MAKTFDSKIKELQEKKSKLDSSILISQKQKYEQRIAELLWNPVVQWGEKKTLDEIRKCYAKMKKIDNKINQIPENAAETIKKLDEKIAFYKQKKENVRNLPLYRDTEEGIEELLWQNEVYQYARETNDEELISKLKKRSLKEDEYMEVVERMLGEVFKDIKETGWDKGQEDGTAELGELKIDKRYLWKYIKGLDKYPILSKEELAELLELYNSTWDIEICNKIVLSNLRYVIFYCERFLFALKDKYNCRGLDINDLIFAWYMWLRNAVESKKFDVNKHNSFLSFAKPYIRWSVIAYIKNVYWFFWRDVFDAKNNWRIPGWSLNKVNLYIDKFYQTYWRLPSDGEIIGFYVDEDMWNISNAKEFLWYYKLLQEWISSIDEIMCNVGQESTETNNINSEILIDEYNRSDKKMDHESLKQELQRSLSTLTDREQNILKRYFWIDWPQYTLEEIWNKLWLTRGRVDQIREKAIRRLRQNSRSKLLRQYLWLL